MTLRGIADEILVFIFKRQVASSRCFGNSSSCTLYSLRVLSSCTTAQVTNQDTEGSGQAGAGLQDFVPSRSEMPELERNSFTAVLEFRREASKVSKEVR